MEASRQILWNVRSLNFLTIAGILAVVSLAVGMGVRWGAWFRGRRGSPVGNRRGRWQNLVNVVLSQKGMIRDPRQLTMHRCLFYGALLLFAGTLLVALDVHFGLRVLRGNVYLAASLILDMAGLALLVGVALACHKRYVVRPERLESGPGDALALALLFVVPLSGFLVKGARQLATSDPWANWSPVGNGAALLLGLVAPPSALPRLHEILWLGHAGLALSSVALLPWSKLLHMVAVPLNHFLSRPWAEGGVPAVTSFDSLPPTGRIGDFTRKQLLEADACLNCGRCRKLCVMYQAGQATAPVNVMNNLKRLLHSGRYSTPTVPAVIPDGALWACSGCRSCEDRCPMNGAHSARIVDIRRARTSMGQAPPEVAARFGDNETTLSTAVGGARRQAPAEKADVHIWPGCRERSASLDATLTLLVRLLTKAGVTVRLLEPHACCGGPVRRLGNESLFLRQAAANIHYLNSLRGATIITPCPHCFTTLSNDYGPLGGRFTVLHHAHYLAGLLAEGRLSQAGTGSRPAVFHDPCFLGRYHGEFSAPRKLIGAAGELTLLDMKHSRMKSFCCGSGGGTVPRAVALSNGRTLVSQALKAGAEAIVTACPYCRDNLSASAREENREKPLRVLDLVELFEPGGNP